MSGWSRGERSPGEAQLLNLSGHCSLSFVSLGHLAAGLTETLSSLRVPGEDTGGESARTRAWSTGLRYASEPHNRYQKPPKSATEVDRSVPNFDVAVFLSHNLGGSPIASLSCGCKLRKATSVTACKAARS